MIINFILEYPCESVSCRDLGNGAAVMILRTYSEADDGGMREGRRAGAVDLGDGAACDDSPALRHKRMMEE
ncbi:hypothetical protein TNCV_3714721 [Trichonephila clavipes]|nr:hypothetical protein TNCV_3714721 [Trichonephila clavipes]